MSTLDKVKAEPKTVLWDELDKVTAVMLGVEGDNNFMRPMAPFSSREDNTIWFFTKKTSNVFMELDSGKMSHICVVNEKDHFWACIKGRLMEADDPAILDRFWSPVVEAWYEGGKQDPALTMLAFHPHSAEISCSSNSKLRFGWEIVKANIKQDEVPDLGTKVVIPLASGL